MLSSSKTLRGAGMGPRIKESTRAATRCVLWLLAEGAVSDAMADEAAELLWLLSCEVSDALKTKRTEEALGETETEIVSRETKEGDADETGQTKVPW